MIIKVINFRTHTNSRIYGAKARIAVRPQIIEMFSNLDFQKHCFCSWRNIYSLLKNIYLGNTLMALVILAITCFYLVHQNLKGALPEVPFYF